MLDFFGLWTPLLFRGYIVVSHATGDGYKETRLETFPMLTAVSRQAVRFYWHRGVARPMLAAVSLRRSEGAKKDGQDPVIHRKTGKPERPHETATPNEQILPN